MNEVENPTIQLKDEFCICRKRLIDNSCPRCDPPRQAKSIVDKAVKAAVRQSRTSTHLRSTGFGKYGYC